MTKWSRNRRRKERRDAEAEERRKTEELQRTEPQIEDLNTQQEKITENVQHSEKRFLKRFSILKKPAQQEKSSENIQQTRENVEQENTQTFKQKTNPFTDSTICLSSGIFCIALRYFLSTYYTQSRRTKSRQRSQGHCNFISRTYRSNTCVQRYNIR